MAEILPDNKKETIDFLSNKPENFRWSVGERIFTKEQLLNEVNKESDMGAIIVSLQKEIGETESSQLGKRYLCLVCGTEMLVLKAGEGKMSCCDQEMATKAPRPLPSSD